MYPNRLSFKGLKSILANTLNKENNKLSETDYSPYFGRHLLMTLTILKFVGQVGSIALLTPKSFQSFTNVNHLYLKFSL